MFTFILISNAGNIFSTVHQTFSEIGSPKNEAGGRIFVETSNGMKDGWIAFQPIENIQYDYESKEIEYINNLIKNPSYYLIEGRNGNINTSNIFIKKISPLGETLIDNDHGMIVDLAEVKRHVESEKDWLLISN